MMPSCLTLTVSASKEDSTLGNATTRLGVVTYEEYLDKYVDQEYNSTGRQGVPQLVAHGPTLEFILTPEPDAAYTLVYEYYRIPVDLELHDDVPAMPERFKHIIVDVLCTMHICSGATHKTHW